MKKSTPKNLSVKIEDTAMTVDKLHTNKRWFNGMKFFHTVKVSPPRK